MTIRFSHRRVLRSMGSSQLSAPNNRFDRTLAARLLDRNHSPQRDELQPSGGVVSWEFVEWRSITLAVEEHSPIPPAYRLCCLTLTGPKMTTQRSPFLRLSSQPHTPPRLFNRVSRSLAKRQSGPARLLRRQTSVTNLQIRTRLTGPSTGPAFQHVGIPIPTQAGYLRRRARRKLVGGGLTK